MNKYIIKNCPAYQTFYSDTTDGSSSTLCTKGFTKTYCQDCTDCVIKQIVEKCGQRFYDNDFGKGQLVIASEILQLLNIQEVE